MQGSAASAIVAALRQAGTARLYGVPGGGSSLDLLAAAQAQGLPFVLARTETAAVIMAATEAELTGAPGAALVTRGPGVAAAVNGMAHAHLDHAPVLLLADTPSADERAFATHQVIDQAGMLAPLLRAAARLDRPSSAAGEVAASLLAAAMTHPRGPVLLELTGAAAKAPASAPVPTQTGVPGVADISAASALLARARRPVLVAGLEAATPEGEAACRGLAAALRAPVLVTYKAKGVVPDDDPLFAGVATGGAAEAPILDAADLIVFAGLDPVEFIPQPWRHAAPILDVAAAARPLPYRGPAASLIGPVAASLQALAETARPAEWIDDEIGAARARWATALRDPRGNGPGITPDALVDAVAAACARTGRDPRIAVDAGAHMFPVTSFWPARRAGDLLSSNGLSTMGFALPAAIAAALHDPARGAIAMTGDGGLAMVLGELATAVALRARLTVVVFNDAALSLIGIKTSGRVLPEGALVTPRIDFAAAIRAVGGVGFTAADADGLEAALDAALTSDGPTLVDVAVDPSGYPAIIAALRG